MANTDYEAGRAQLAMAITADTFGAMTRRLTLTYHHLLTAKTIADLLLQEGGTRPVFHFTPIIIEEALVCTLVGITDGTRFCAQHPDTEARALLRRHGPSLTALRPAARSRASEIYPSFTRFFADILAAQALTLAAAAETTLAGIAELQRLRGKLSASGGLAASFADFEAGWIDTALLKALRSTGATIPAQALAADIAGRLALRNRAWRSGLAPAT